MATYKVLQDIEAEDKLVGPLSLRQFIYACISAFCLYICFIGLSKGTVFLIFIFLPVALISGFFGFPWKGEQPTEIWALARLRFMVKPRTRIWNQDGMKDVVTVTVPRRAPVRQQRNLSQYEVRSRLKALADTIDSRGWATRNANYQYYMSQQRGAASDRLVNASDLQPGSIPMDAFLPSNDMLDEQNPVAQNFNALLAKSGEQKRQRVLQGMSQAQAPQQVNPAAPAGQPAGAGGMRIISPQLPAPAMPFAPPQSAFAQPAMMQQPANPAAPSIRVPAAALPAMPAAMPPAQVPGLPPPVANDSWFMQAPGYPAGAPQAQAPLPVAPGMPFATPPPPDSAALEEQLVQQMVNGQPSAMEVNLNHMRVVQPAGQSSPADASETGGQAPAGPAPNAQQAPQNTVTRQPDPAILELANNDDLDVATLARQASKEIKKAPDEVEIQLH
jgi:hypothetical protein